VYLPLPTTFWQVEAVMAAAPPPPPPVPPEPPPLLLPQPAANASPASRAAAAKERLRTDFISFPPWLLTPDALVTQRRIAEGV
jgi:hypothetical protein